MPKPACGYVGCGQVATFHSYCDKHQPKTRLFGRSPDHVGYKGTRTVEKYHENNVLYGRRWRVQAQAYLTAHPICVECAAHGIQRMATVVDHRIPHKGDMKLFWDAKNNWQSLCRQHHDYKTNSRDGGFGNRIVSDNRSV